MGSLFRCILLGLPTQAAPSELSADSANAQELQDDGQTLVVKLALGDDGEEENMPVTADALHTEPGLPVAVQAEALASFKTFLEDELTDPINLHAPVVAITRKLLKLSDHDVTDPRVITKIAIRSLPDGWGTIIRNIDKSPEAAGTEMGEIIGIVGADNNLQVLSRSLLAAYSYRLTSWQQVPQVGRLPPNRISVEH